MMETPGKQDRGRNLWPHRPPLPIRQPASRAGVSESVDLPPFESCEWDTEVPVTTPHHTFKGIKSKWFGKLLSEKRQRYQMQKKKKGPTSHDWEEIDICSAENWQRIDIGNKELPWINKKWPIEKWVKNMDRPFTGWRGGGGDKWLKNLWKDVQPH